MKPFKFLNPSLYTNGDIELPSEIIDCCIQLCQIYKDYVESCRREFLNSHPHINPNSDYGFRIPNNPIERDFPEGKVWHGGSDYYEEEDIVTHFVYMDVPGYGEQDDYFFEINEDNFGGFYINEIGRDRSRWD
jgi:hypothetical protein